MDELKRLWAQLPHMKAQRDSVVRWMARKGSVVKGGFAESAYDLKLAIDTYPTMNFYVCPNPTFERLGIRHSSEDVSHWSWLLVDVDPIDLAVAQPQAAMDRALEILCDWFQWALVPLIIDSGRGMQAWIRIEDRPVDQWLWDGTTVPSIGLRWQATRTCRYWLQRLDDAMGDSLGCRIDTSCSDLPRAMRCPGTVNQKTGRIARIVREGSMHRNLGAQMIASVPEPFFEMPPVSGPAVGMPWQFAVSHLTVKARRFIEEGWQEPGRHDAMWHTAKRMQEAGISREEARKALCHGNAQCRLANGKPGPLTLQELEHALDTSYGRVV